MKTATLALCAVISLGGCVAVPAYPPGTYGPGYAPPAVGVYVAPPPVRYYGGYGYYGHRHGHWR